MISIKLGNGQAHETLSDDEIKTLPGGREATDETLAELGLERYGSEIIRDRSDIGETYTEIAHPNQSVLECIHNVKALWVAHSKLNPTWVASDNPMVAQLLSEEFASVGDDGARVLVPIVDWS